VLATSGSPKARLMVEDGDSIVAATGGIGMTAWRGSVTWSDGSCEDSVPRSDADDIIACPGLATEVRCRAAVGGAG
jgi:hypothetical protein